MDWIQEKNPTDPRRVCCTAVLTGIFKTVDAKHEARLSARQPWVGLTESESYSSKLLV